MFKFIKDNYQLILAMGLVCTFLYIQNVEAQNTCNTLLTPVKTQCPLLGN